MEHGPRDLPLVPGRASCGPELRIQVTNLFNHTNWGRPVTTFTDPRFMTFTPAAAHQVNTLFGTATVERQIQIGLRLEF